MRGTEPTGLSKVLRSELDWIVMKALEKDRGRRYDSATGFAADVQRYLAGEPVPAHPPSAGYRLKKFVRRHKGRVVAASLVVLALLAGIVGTSIGLVQAENRRAEADRARAAESERVAERDAPLQTASQRVTERDAALKAVRSGAARLALDRGLILCDQGDMARGLSALTRATALAAEPADADLESAARFNLAAWERRVWRLRAVLTGPEGAWASAAAMNPQGTVLAVALADKTTQLRDAAAGSEGRVLHTLPHEGLVVEFQFSPDGRLLLTRTDRAVHLWNVGTGQLVCPPLRHEFRVLAMALSPDDKLILSGEENQAGGLKASAPRRGPPLGRGDGSATGAGPGTHERRHRGGGPSRPRGMGRSSCGKSQRGNLKATRYRWGAGSRRPGSLPTAGG